MIGKQVKEYRIKQEIGKGGMASVFLVEHTLLHYQAALKLLNKEYVHNDNIRKRFMAEARNMFRMSHPNIIKVTDLIDDGDTVAFVMEYIEGETLKEYLDRKGKLKDDEIKPSSHRCWRRWGMCMSRTWCTEILSRRTS